MAGTKERDCAGVVSEDVVFGTQHFLLADLYRVSVDYLQAMSIQSVRGKSMKQAIIKGYLQFFSVLMLSVFSVPPSQAGILNGIGNAFNGITGSVPFNNGVGLSGTIDYAVFTAANFNANFLGLGYVPGDALVYTYQVNVTGSLGVSTEIIGISNPANTIGTFNIGDQDAASASFIPNARWFFSPEIPTGLSSWGLAFSSPNLPIVGASLTIDGGTQALVAGVPTPGPFALPEPTSMTIFASSILWWCSRRQGIPARSVGAVPS